MILIQNVKVEKYVAEDKDSNHEQTPDDLEASSFDPINEELCNWDLRFQD